MSTQPDHCNRDFIGFWLRATELRALPDGRFEIVVELTPRKKKPVPKRGISPEESEAADEHCPSSHRANQEKGTHAK